VIRHVKITAHMATPLAGPELPYLDAICEAAMVRHKSWRDHPSGRHRVSRKERGANVPVADIGRIPTPIAKRFVCNLPIPRCSSAIADEVKHDEHQHVTSAWPVSRAPLLSERERIKITAGGGRFKSFRLPLRTRLISRLVWFAAIKEQPSRLRMLLRNRVRAIGKKTADGYGVVSRWEVDTIASDWSWFAESGNGPVLMRPLPVDADLPDGLIGARCDFGGCCPPYWQQNIWREIVVPC